MPSGRQVNTVVAFVLFFCLKKCGSFYYKPMCSSFHGKGVGKMCPMAGYSMFPHRLKVFENENNVSCNSVISANEFFQIDVIGDDSYPQDLNRDSSLLDLLSCGRNYFCVSVKFAAA